MNIEEISSELLGQLIKSNENLTTIILVQGIVFIGLIFGKYIFSRAVTSGEINEKFNKIPKLDQIEKIITNSKTLSEIETKLSNVSKIADIERTVAVAISKAIKDIDFSYWNKQQIEQIKRERIEKLMNEVSSSMRETTQKHVDLLNKGELSQLLCNQQIPILINLYFPELSRDLNLYEHSFSQYANLYSNIVWKNINNLTIIEDNSKLILQKQLEELILQNSILTTKVTGVARELTNNLNKDDFYKVKNNDN